MPTFYDTWRLHFLDHIQRHRMPYNDTTGANAAGVDLSIKIERSLAPKRWRVIGIHHLTGQENGGKHNLYFGFVDKNGNHVPSNWLGWVWEGQQPGQLSPPVQADKPYPAEPPGNLPIWNSAQHVRAWALGRTATSNEPSDKVVNVRTDWPDQGPGNSIGHHSHLVIWQWWEGEPEPEPEPDPGQPPAGTKITKTFEDDEMKLTLTIEYK